MDFKGMSIVEIIDLALRDDKFAHQFKDAAILACNTTVGSKEWQDFMKFFAADPNELARLMDPAQQISNPIWTGRQKTIVPTGTGGNTTVPPTTNCDRPDLTPEEKERLIHLQNQAEEAIGVMHSPIPAKDDE